MWEYNSVAEAHKLSKAQPQAPQHLKGMWRQGLLGVRGLLCCTTFLPQKGDHKGKQCFYYYHNDDLFGIDHDDTNVSDVKESDQAYP